MVRYGKQHGINLNGLLRNFVPRDFIPASTKAKFSNLFNKQRLVMNFKPHLEKQYKQYEMDTVENTQMTYVKGILQYAEHYGMETFTLRSSCSPSESTFAKVKPHDSTFPGLDIYEGEVMLTVLYIYLLDVTTAR